MLLLAGLADDEGLLVLLGGKVCTLRNRVEGIVIGPVSLVT